MPRIVSLAVLVVLSGLELSRAAERPEIQDITWAKGPPMRYWLKFHAQGLIGDRILGAAGTQVPGCGPDHVTDRVWLFDPKTGGYEDLPPAPLPLGKPDGIVVR